MTETPPNVAGPTAESPPPPPTGGRRRRHTVLASVASIIAALVVAAIVAGFVIHLPKVIISPGSATPLDQSVVRINGAKTYAHRGNLLFLTVRVTTHDPSLWRVVTAWFDPDQDVEDRTTVNGCLTDAQNEQLNTQLMDQSQNDARYVALKRLGYTVPADPPQVLVGEVCRGYPAYGKLEIGDRLVAIDGSGVGDGRAVQPLVRAHKPGESITVSFVRNGANRVTTVRAGRVVGPATDPKCEPVERRARGTACIGIKAQPVTNYHFPVNVAIDTQRVGGPSAGLAFALAVIDDLTPGSLTGGKRVAVTGAIDSDGTVEEVGGVEQKAITARANGVDLMIVPKGEVKDARRGAGHVRVVGVGTLDEALVALRRIGGASVPPASPTTARS